MPLADEGFDVVLCGMGLQFFPERLAALREILRVLAPGGRLVANLPGPAPPLFGIMADALARHVSPESARFVHVVFALHDVGTLQGLATEAGFHDVTVRSAVKTLRLPPPADFLWQYVNSTPLAAVVARAGDEQRTALERDVATRAQEFVEHGGLTIRVNMITMTATK